MAYSVRFTKKQSEHVHRIVSEWASCADARGTLPPLLHVKIKLLRDMIEDGIAFADDDFEFLALLLQLTLLSLGPNEVDPLAEQAYAKCAGEWAILPPWYDRVRALSTDRQLPALGT
jgi:hypothetical protein